MQQNNKLITRYFTLALLPSFILLVAYYYEDITGWGNVDYRGFSTKSITEHPNQQKNLKFLVAALRNTWIGCFLCVCLYTSICVVSCCCLSCQGGSASVGCTIDDATAVSVVIALMVNKGKNNIQTKINVLSHSSKFPFSNWDWSKIRAAFWQL